MCDCVDQNLFVMGFVILLAWSWADLVDFSGGFWGNT